VLSARFRFADRVGEIPEMSTGVCALRTPFADAMAKVLRPLAAVEEIKSKGAPARRGRK
jgi:hypothetical protein